MAIPHKHRTLLKPFSFLVMRARIFCFLFRRRQVSSSFPELSFRSASASAAGDVQECQHCGESSQLPSPHTSHSHPPMHTSYQVKNYRSRGSKEIKLSHTEKKTLYLWPEKAHTLTTRAACARICEKFRAINCAGWQKARPSATAIKFK
jgi:hypothetical protein